MEIINGFKVIKHLGRIIGKKYKRSIIECKICKKEYEIDTCKILIRKHCGCINNGGIRCSYVKSHPKLRRTHRNIMRRCYYKKDKCFYLYGAKGIKVCEEWNNNPDKFCEWSLLNGYSDDLSIDRINSNGDYSPENCRWTDNKTQLRNTSRNVLTLDLAKQMRQDRLSMTYEQLAKKYKVSEGTVNNVVNNKSWI